MNETKRINFYFFLKKNINNLQPNKLTLVYNIKLLIEQPKPTFVCKELGLIMEKLLLRIVSIKHKILTLLI